MNVFYIFLIQVKESEKKYNSAFTTRCLPLAPSEIKTSKGGLITLTNDREPFLFSLLCYNSAPELLSLKVNAFFQTKDCGKCNHNSFSIVGMHYFKEYKKISQMFPWKNILGDSVES